MKGKNEKLFVWLEKKRLFFFVLIFEKNVLEKRSKKINKEDREKKIL